MFLTKPTTKYKQSFLQALSEYHHEGRYSDYDREEISGDFDRFCEMLNAMSETDEDDEKIPTSTYWMIDDEEYIGKVEIRHRLYDRPDEEGGHIIFDVRPSRRRLGYGTKMLELAVREAKDLNLDRILVICDSTNFATRKIIIGLGGEMEEEISRGVGFGSIVRYWIQINKRG